MVYILYYIINYNNDLILQTALLASLEYTATKQCFACGSISGVGEAAVWIGNTFIFGKSYKKRPCPMGQSRFPYKFCQTGRFIFGRNKVGPHSGPP